MIIFIIIYIIGGIIGACQYYNTLMEGWNQKFNENLFDFSNIAIAAACTGLTCWPVSIPFNLFSYKEHVRWFSNSAPPRKK